MDAVVVRPGRGGDPYGANVTGRTFGAIPLIQLRRPQDQDVDDDAYLSGRYSPNRSYLSPDAVGVADLWIRRKRSLGPRDYLFIVFVEAALLQVAILETTFNATNVSSIFRGIGPKLWRDT
jgi:hypothetical protein